MAKKKTVLNSVDATEPCFNLIDEPWLAVIDSWGNTSTVSLADVFAHAHEISELDGEMEAQNIAVLRLLLAILHSVFYRVDASGQGCPLTEDNAVERWQEIWEQKCFPAEAITAYFDTWHERFWLFHPERPFAQVNEAGEGTSYPATKLNGQLSESNNKRRLFSLFGGETKGELSFAEAARWLLYLNAFDDTSNKATSACKAAYAANNAKPPSTGAGWLGKLGVIAAKGNNLFETLMLNLVLRNPANSQVGAEPKPFWELAEPRTSERTQIVVPDNAAQLLVLQSRRLLLQREGNRVVGYGLLGGDFFEKTEAYPLETMTSWIFDKVKNTSKDKDATAVAVQPTISPRRHNLARQMWRDFSMLFIDGYSTSKKSYIPAMVVKWIGELREAECLDDTLVRFVNYGVGYADKDMCINDVSTDSLTLNVGLLRDLKAGEWLERIRLETETIEAIAAAVYRLEADIIRASGGELVDDKDKAPCYQAQERYYHAVDNPFRAWLTSLSADADGFEMSEQCEAWRSRARRIAQILADELCEEAGLQALAGRVVNENVYSTPKAKRIFDLQLNKLTAPEQHKEEVEVNV